MFVLWQWIESEHISRFRKMTEHSMHLVYIPKLIFIPIYCRYRSHSLSQRMDVSTRNFYIYSDKMSPHRIRNIALYILLYFIEMISLLSFPFYLFSTSILFIFICWDCAAGVCVCALAFNWIGTHKWILSRYQQKGDTHFSKLLHSISLIHQC